MWRTSVSRKVKCFIRVIEIVEDDHFTKETVMERTKRAGKRMRTKTA